MSSARRKRRRTATTADTVITSHARPSSSSTGSDSVARRTLSVESTILIPHGLPPVQTSAVLHWLYLYFRFCAERQEMWEKRQAGFARNETSEDETMRRTFVGNIFRELDAGSERLQEVIDTGDQSNDEICFRVFLYCGFYSPTTWRALIDGLGENPSWSSFDLEKYERILHERSFVRGEKIYYGGFQNVPPTKYFGRLHPLPHYAATLRFIMSLMEMKMPSQLLLCRYASDASSILQTVPTIGGFLSLNLLTYLNGSPHLDFEYRNFASCGPGSRAFLQRIFGKSTINSIAMEEAGLRWLFENQWRFLARIGKDPPHAWSLGLRPGMRVLDLENALCWCHRYVNDFERKRYRNLAQMSHPVYDVNVTEDASAPAWCDEERYAEISGEASAICQVHEEDDLESRIGACAEEGVYEVEKIIGRKGNRTDRDGLFRVRWNGYQPEDDTWERASSLRQGAQEVLDEWLEWETGVWSAIDKVARDHPYKAAKVQVKDEGGTAQL